MSSNALLWPSQGTIPERMLDKYKWLRVPSQGVAGQVLVPPVAPGIMAYQTLDIMSYGTRGWFDLLWQQSIPLTINASQVPSIQNNFQLLIKSTFSSLIGESADELRFAGIDNIQLDYFIQFFNPATGELIAWVLMPTISDGDVINIYYDNPAATDEQDPLTVWSNNDFVYPLDEADSTVNNLVGVNSTRTGTTQVDGQIHKATNFANNTEFIQLVSSDWTTQNNQSTFSISFWYKTTDSDRGVFIGDFDSSDTMQFNIELRNSELRIFARDESMVTTDELSGVDPAFIDGNPHHIVVVYDGSTRIFKMYFDNTLVITSAARPNNTDTFFNPGNQFFLARDSRTTVNYVGDLEFMEKINNIALSDDAVTTKFNNQNDTSVFYNIGAVETPPDIMGYGTT